MSPLASTPMRWILAGAVLSATMLGGLLWLNLVPRPHPGFEDLRNPMAEPWSPDPRAERGWPCTAHRRFDHPSEVNARGVWDGLGLLLDIGVLVAGLGLVWLIVLVRVVRANRVLTKGIRRT